MNDQEREIDLGFTQEVLPECHHLCLIYDSEEQRRKIVSEYLAAGLKRGEFVRYFSDITPPEDIRAWLSESGIDLPKAEEDGSFGIVKAENAYCPSGRFVPQEVLDGVAARYTMLKKTSYSGSRVSGEMTWVLRDIPDSDRFLEYEVGLNMITETFPYIGMCQYDARRFDGATLFKVLQVHPYMIAQGQIVRNPFYLKPEEFLAKFQANA
jgi:hypothetical protein